MIRRPPRSTQSRSSAASDVYKRQVVTLDLHMPGMDGLEVLDQLGNDETTATVPIVIVSAYSSDRRLRTRKQIKAILQKPFDVDELCRTVRKAANPPEPPHPEHRGDVLLNRHVV